MKRYLISCLILIAPLVAFSQNFSISQDKLKWTVSSFDNASNNDRVTQSSYFTSTSDKIDWVQNNGAKTYSFQVVSSDGNWPSTSTNGSIEFQVSIGSKSGTIRFYRENGQLMILMNFMVDGKNIMPYKFHVQQIEKI